MNVPARAPWIPLAAAGAAAVAAGLSGCFSAPRATQPPPGVHISPSTEPGASHTPQQQPPPPESVPDAIPRFEPRSLLGNPPFYEVFGKRYYVLPSSVDYVERGVASWYGPGFHKVRTSMGEPYDMYGMTAAHKTLPLPAYVRVTNLENGRSVVLRVNDRGPFVGNRIIDLSYTAAAKLDMLRNGTAMVEVRAVQPSDPARDLNVAAPGAPGAPNLGAAAAAPASAFASASTLAAAPAPAPSPTTFAPAGISTADRTVAPAVAPPGTPATVPTGAAAPTHAIGPAPVPAPVPAGVPAGALYVQAGAFADPANAQRLAGKLRDAGYGGVFVRDDLIAGHRLYRVRIGPVPNVPQFDRIVAALERVGVRDAHLALD